MENKNDETINFENQSQQQTKFELNFKLKLKQRILLTILLTIGLGLYVIIANPILNFRFSTGLANLMIAFLLYAAIWLKDIRKIFTLITVFIIIQIGISIYSSPIFHADAYYNLIGEVTEKNYEDDMPKIDESRIPVVDEELARKLGDKVLGNDLGLGSQYEIGDYYFVSTEDDLVWVAPLEPQSFFKWFKNRDGAPGYVYVSATNPNDVRLVKDVDGKDIKLKYTNKSYLLSEIKRHAYINKNYLNAMTDFSFEIDDNGKPYWVITTYEPTIGFSGYDTKGVVIVDAQSGEVTNYDDLSKLPDWVERVQPTSIVKNQLIDWGAYKNGWLNTVFAQNEMIQPTEGHGYVYIEGEPYYYTGLTSIKSDESTVGFMLVNTKTKASTFYKINGATEYAAQKSAEGQVQQYNYKASFPILLNVNNTPTYFMTLKDEDGLIKQYAYVSVRNYNIVGVGSTRDKAEQNYREQLKANGELDVKVDEASLKTVTGKIERLTYLNGEYYLKLVDNKTLFMINEDVSKFLKLTKEGDDVELKYNETSDDYQQVSSFKNNTIE